MEYFLAVAEEGQITKAAERLHITQPPLSRQIKLLENELGVLLFERHGKHIELTEAGNILRKRAEEMLVLVSLSKKELLDVNNGDHGLLSVAAVASLGTYFLNKYIIPFHKLYPLVTFHMWEGETFRVTELLSKGIAEIGIVRTPFDTKTYDSIINKNMDPMVAAYSGNFNFESEENLSPATLKGKPLIVLRRNMKNIADTCRMHGFEPEIFCISDEINTMLRWAQAGLGIALVPKSSCFNLEISGMHYKDISEKSFESGYAAIWLKNISLSPVAKNFIKLINSKIGLPII